MSKKTFCICCKWATYRWLSRRYFCRASLMQNWSWVRARAERTMKPCTQLNFDGQCAFYKAGLQKRFWDWWYQVTWNVKKRG